MTAQIGDRLRWNRRQHCLLGELPLEETAVVPSAEEVTGVLNTTACWRRYRALWGISRGRLYLLGVEGRFEMATPGPVFAGWITDYLRIAAGNLAAYDHREYFSTYHGVIEFEVLAGVVTRRRTFSVPASENDAPWVRAPETAHLFSRPSSSETMFPREEKVILEPGLRELCTRARSRRGLTPGEIAKAMGRRSDFGSKLVEWERGQRDLRPEILDALMSVYAIEPDIRIALARADDARRAQAVEQWYESPIEPVLHVGDLYFHQPDAGDPMVWAERCAQAAWRPATLWISRRRFYKFDQQGRLLQAPS